MNRHRSRPRSIVAAWILGSAGLLGCGAPSAPAGAVAAIELSDAVVTLDAVGASVSVEAVARDGDGAPVTVAIQWTSSDERVATVSASGLVRAVADGRATIAAAAGGRRAELVATVAQAAVGVAFLDQPVDALVDADLAPVRAATVDRLGHPVRRAAAPFVVELLDASGAPIGPPASTLPANGVATWTVLRVADPVVGLTLRVRAGGFEARSERFDVVSAPDRLELASAHRSPVAVLIDAFSLGADRNDVPFVVTDGIAVGLLRKGHSGELIAMARGHGPLVLADAGWTAGVDTVRLMLPDRLSVPVAVWMVGGAFAVEADVVAAVVDETGQLFDAQGAGMTFVTTIHDATAAGSDPRFDDVRSCTVADELGRAVGHTAGAVNVYVVRRANGSRLGGMACPIGGETVVVGLDVDRGLLAHEFGHAFGLLHVDALPEFDQTNVMHSNSFHRGVFTDGQILRMHLEPGSPAAALRRPEIRRACGNAFGFRCPRLDLRMPTAGAAASVLRMGPADRSSADRDRRG